MKKTLLVILALSLISGYTLAQTKIAVVDPQKILRFSKEGKKILSELEAYKSRKEAEIQRRSKEVKKLEDKIATQRLTLSQEALNKLMEELDRKKTALKRYVEDAQKELTKLQQEKFMAFQRTARRVVEKVAKAKGIDIVFDRMQSGIVYNSPAIDITNDVIKELDRLFAAKMGGKGKK